MINTLPACNKHMFCEQMSVVVIRNLVVYMRYRLQMLYNTHFSLVFKYQANSNSGFRGNLSEPNNG